LYFTATLIRPSSLTSFGSTIWKSYSMRFFSRSREINLLVKTKEQEPTIFDCCWMDSILGNGGGEKELIINDQIDLKKEWYATPILNM
jgi:hypothetical protein